MIAGEHHNQLPANTVALCLVKVRRIALILAMHLFNENDFCLKCGWEKNYLIKTNKHDCDESKLLKICSNCNGAGRLKNCRTSGGIPQCPVCLGSGKIKIQLPSSETSSVKAVAIPDAPIIKKPIDWVGIFKFVGATLIVLAILTLIVSPNENPHTQPDYLGSATEKLDKGLPLNNLEQQSLNKALGIKSDKEQAKEIEKKHGE